MSQTASSDDSRLLTRREEARSALRRNGCVDRLAFAFLRRTGVPLARQLDELALGFGIPQPERHLLAMVSTLGIGLRPRGHDKAVP